MSQRQSTHPGAILREDVFPALGISITELALHLGISDQTLHSVLSGESSISPELALRIGNFLGNGPQLWLEMQSKFDKGLSCNQIWAPPFITHFSNNNLLIDEALYGGNSVNHRAYSLIAVRMS